MNDTAAQPPATPLERLEADICELAGHLAAATCRWLLMVAEFDRREGWAQWGVKSCAHWLSWKCGVAPGAARERLRVARALASLPDVTSAFSAGQLSYSKVRALTRVANAENEADLVAIALSATASQVETLVRGHRRVERCLRTGDDRRHAERYLRWHWDDDGALVLRGRLGPEQGALVLAALAAVRDGRWEEETTEDVPAGTFSAPAEAAAEHGSLLPVRTEPDMSAEDGPRDNADALVTMAETLLATGPAHLRAGERYTVVVHVDLQTLRTGSASSAGAPASSSTAIGTRRAETEAGLPLLPETLARLACDSSVVSVVEDGTGQPLDVGRKTRSVPAGIRRALRCRDRGCRFPGCTERRHVDAHHIRHWIHGGHTSLINLILLCEFHHRCVHESGFVVVPLGSGRFRFLRPDGRHVPEQPVPPQPDGCLEDRQQHLGIVAETIVGTWNGDRLDLDAALYGLLNRPDGGGTLVG